MNSIGAKTTWRRTAAWNRAGALQVRVPTSHPKTALYNRPDVELSGLQSLYGMPAVIKLS